MPFILLTIGFILARIIHQSS